jgi:hypothetical protein
MIFLNIDLWPQINVIPNHDYQLYSNCPHSLEESTRVVAMMTKQKMKMKKNQFNDKKESNFCATREISR